MTEEQFETSSEPPQGQPFAEAPAAPDDGDRALAAVAHIFGWITGVVILVVGQQRSAFVRFHALQALVVDLLLTVAGALLGMVLSFVFTALATGLMFMMIPASGDPEPGAIMAIPAMFAIMFPCIGLIALAPWGLRLYAIVRAATGHLYAYPLIGRWLKPGP